MNHALTDSAPTARAAKRYARAARRRPRLNLVFRRMIPRLVRRGDVTISDVIDWENPLQMDAEHKVNPRKRIGLGLLIGVGALTLPAFGIAKLRDITTVRVESHPAPVAEESESDVRADHLRMVAPRMVDHFTAFHKADTLDAKASYVWNSAALSGAMCDYYHTRPMIPDWIREGAEATSYPKMRKEGGRDIYILSTKHVGGTYLHHTYFRKVGEDLMIDWPSTMEFGEMSLRDFYRTQPEKLVSLYVLLGYGGHYEHHVSKKRYVAVKIRSLRDPYGRGDAYFVRGSGVAIEYNHGLALAAASAPVPKSERQVVRPALRWIVKARFKNPGNGDEPYPVIEECLAPTWWPENHQTLEENHSKQTNTRNYVSRT